MGEDGAKGWKHTPDDADPPTPPPDTTTLANIASESDPFEKWATTERLTAASQRRPARPTDPGVDDDVDPFRVVLFDDVRDFLFIVHSPDSKLQLAYAFLTFLGLPFVPPDYPTSTTFNIDSFIHSELVERPDLRQQFWPKLEIPEVPFETVSGEAMEPERKSALKEPFDVPFHISPVSIDLLFATRSKWFLTMSKAELAHVDVQLVRYVSVPSVFDWDPILI